ncbi:hypothetical protein E1301_Tti019014 [Triplophysa tibetana]|uniref:Immunoglobulin domain-containing protein n=1 Tax=Triplophysa tibetana TaxID=1572043 RepID=A0A5A9MXF4_9TELE|nr:hypothetical protein E1301_Tti019014 [Triplophysa tibetana]
MPPHRTDQTSPPVDHTKFCHKFTPGYHLFLEHSQELSHFPGLSEEPTYCFELREEPTHCSKESTDHVQSPVLHEDPALSPDLCEVFAHSPVLYALPTFIPGLSPVSVLVPELSPVPTLIPVILPVHICCHLSPVICTGFYPYLQFLLSVPPACPRPVCHAIAARFMPFVQSFAYLVWELPDLRRRGLQYLEDWDSHSLLNQSDRYRLNPAHLNEQIRETGEKNGSKGMKETEKTAQQRKYTVYPEETICKQKPRVKVYRELCGRSHVTSQAITFQVQKETVTAPIQGSVFFSVDIQCIGIPTIRWMLRSPSRQQRIVAWTPGGSVNITDLYEKRVTVYPNGSLTISKIQLQDSGYYIITVTEPSGNSKDAGVLLIVTVEEPESRNSKLYIDTKLEMVIPKER